MSTDTIKPSKQDAASSASSIMQGLVHAELHKRGIKDYVLIMYSPCTDEENPEDLFRACYGEANLNQPRHWSTPGDAPPIVIEGVTYFAPCKVLIWNGRMSMQHDELTRMAQITYADLIKTELGID